MDYKQVVKALDKIHAEHDSTSGYSFIAFVGEKGGEGKFVVMGSDNEICNTIYNAMDKSKNLAGLMRAVVIAYDLQKDIS